jgi:iron complex outermembrane receptor protein
MKRCTARIIAPAFAFMAIVTTSAFPGDSLEEIIVTAQRREQSAQDVPIAIVAISGEELRQLDLQSSTDITKAAPEVQRRQHAIWKGC